MKRIVAIVLLLLLTAPAALAASNWQDSILPPPGIEDSAVLFKVVPDKTDVIRVGQDIPAGLYGVSAGMFGNSPVLHTDFMFGVMRGTETVFQSSQLNTETSAELIIHLNDGDILLMVTSLGNIVYLYSVDTVMLRPY